MESGTRYCCANCFTSPILQDFINADGEENDCDFCSKTRVKTVVVSDLYELFEPILRLYKEIEYMRDYHEGDDPHNYGDYLPILIADDWYGSIFSDDFDDSMIDEFLHSLMPEPWEKDDLDNRIALDSLYINVEKKLEELWFDFCDYIMSKRRFLFEDEFFLNFRDFWPEILSGIEIKIGKDEKYYRARLGSEDDTRPFKNEEMGAPPREKTLYGGRANPPGISFLYLSDHHETAVSEVRPWKKARVHVASFKTIKEIRLIDLTADFKIKDPFQYGEELICIVENKRLLRRLSWELSKPVHPHKANIEYIPTQYITEIIRNLHYDGMIYPSALGKGKNIVLFDENVVQIDGDVELYQVDTIDYSISTFDPWADDYLDL